MHFVYIEEKGKLRKQNVKKGATDGDWTEIVEGATVGKRWLKILPTTYMTEWK